MKKLFVFAASAMMVFASCTDNEIVYQNETPQEISLFSVVNNMTRAAQDATTGFRHSTMEVAAYLAGGDGVESTGDYFNGTTFRGTAATDDDPASVFKGARYWPIQDAILNFLAVAPSNDAVTTVFGSGADEEAGTENSNFAGTATVNVTNIDRNQHDVMYAIATGQKSTGNVTMEFKHALAWLNFAFKTNNEELDITINEVRVYGANYTGELVVTQTGYNQIEDQREVSIAWTDGAFKKQLTDEGTVVTNDGGVKVPESGTGNMTLDPTETDFQPWQNGLLVVPTEDPTKFVIDYTVAYDNGPTHTYKYTYTLNNDEVETKWEKGTKYTYNVTMNFANEIQIAPTVSGWGTTTDTPVTIQ